MDTDELRRLAKNTGFDLATLEKDYALTWLLSGVYSDESNLADLLIFKGGTALRKVYFAEWRLSDDLDFTIVRTVSPTRVREAFEGVFKLLNQSSSIEYSFNAFDSGAYSILADVQFLGPLGFKNKIAQDISLREKLVEKSVWKKVRPSYDEIPEFKVQVYSLNEILVEKIRSIIQRGKTRDYYDVWRVLKERRFKMSQIKRLLVRKCKISGVEYRPDLIFDESRLSDAEKFWTIALARLTKNLPDFQSVVSELKSMLTLL